MSKVISSLVRRGTMEIVSKDEVPDNANIIGGRFVLTIEDTETDRPFCKARYVMRGQKDRKKKV